MIYGGHTEQALYVVERDDGDETLLLAPPFDLETAFRPNSNRTNQIQSIPPELCF